MRNKIFDFLYNLFANEESGIKVVGDYWFARYSNAFKDREDEFFPTEAIDRYIERVDTGVIPSPELWVWHTPIVIGKAKTVARIGLFAVAVGTFADTPVGHAAKAYLSKQKAKLSHGFVFDKDAYKDGAYWDYNTFEISILPFGKGVEANAYTNIEVKDMKISDEKLKFFAEMFGEDTAKTLVANTEKASKALEEAGVQFKDFTNVGDMKKPPAEGDKPDAAEDDEEAKKKKALTEANWKSLVADMMGDMGEVAEGQLKLAKEVNGFRAALEQAQKDFKAQLEAQQKSFNERIVALGAENKALRDELALTPKGTRASQSEDTEVEDKDLKDKLKAKEEGEADSFWRFAKDTSKK